MHYEAAGVLPGNQGHVLLEDLYEWAHYTGREARQVGSARVGQTSTAAATQVYRQLQHWRSARQHGGQQGSTAGGYQQMMALQLHITAPISSSGGPVGGAKNVTHQGGRRVTSPAEIAGCGWLCKLYSL